MSDLNIELPPLRPLARQGAAYRAELKAILKAEGQAIVAEERIVFHRNGKVTVKDVCRIALAHRLNLKVTFDYLEERGALACGTYESLKDRGLRPMAALKEVWAEMQQEGT